MKKKILFLILSIALVTAIMPKGIIVDLYISRGQKWTEPTLVAPFDIPLLKTQQQLNEDRLQIESAFEPIYVLDTSIVERITDSLTKELYRRGIINTSDVENIPSGSIRIIRDNNLEHVKLSSVLTVAAAEKILAESDGGNSRKLTDNLKCDENLSSKDKKALSDKVSSTNGLIREGDIIVSNGQIIDQDTQLRIDSYTKEYKQRMGTRGWWLWMTLGRLIIIALVLIANFAYLNFYVEKSQVSLKNFGFIMGTYVILLTMFSLVHKVEIISPYILPTAIVPLFFLTFFNRRISVIGNVTISILAALFTEVPFEFFTVSFLAGMTVIVTMKEFSHRKDLFRAISCVLCVEIVTVIAFQLIEGYSILNRSTLYLIMALLINNIILLGLYQLVFVIEKVFNFVSDITLLENSDTNQPLLTELSHKAPGTFQHSVMVANLAEAAAKSIGAKSLLARCGALYHDIGKMEDPTYFIENVIGENPHDVCSPLQSAQKIKSHVTNGLEIAKKNNLPDMITRFIETHHGNSIISFFYRKAQEESSDVDPMLFSYPGRNPVTKEECICMMCDTIEAASRSLPSYDFKSIDTLVETLINKQISEGHYKNSDITFREVTQIKELLKEELRNIYHVRIAYPAEKGNESNAADRPESRITSQDVAD